MVSAALRGRMASGPNRVPGRDGQSPASRGLAARRAGWRRLSGACLLCATAAVVAPAQTFTNLWSFSGFNGSNPELVSLVQGPDGNMWGTTEQGGSSNCGTVFKITPSGVLSTVFSFDCTDGAGLAVGLSLGKDGNFYGVTGGGGGHGDGSVFKLTPGGSLTTVFNFSGTNGVAPYGTLVQGTDGNFYGTTNGGGSIGYGTVFKITPGGTLTTLHSFDFAHGSNPTGGVIQGADGNFYGTTGLGGSGGQGVVYEISAGGAFKVLYNFQANDGQNANGSLVQGTDGNFYGTTSAGGPGGSGTLFKITPRGTLTTFHSFNYNVDGAYPSGTLVQAADGNFYGTTAAGGAICCGTIFKITKAAVLTTLHNFADSEGSDLLGGLGQRTDGTFYGVANYGGQSNDGTVFSLVVGLGPFVRTLPSSGTVGTPVTILGTNLTSASSVTFNGTAAIFAVVSSSEITTSVPSGATSGQVLVKTAAGTLAGNTTFRVTPVISSFTPTGGPPGTTVIITGQSLTGTSAVTFGGIKATSWTVTSADQITATVPTGARTGRIGVTTPGGTAISPGIFTVP